VRYHARLPQWFGGYHRTVDIVRLHQIACVSSPCAGMSVEKFENTQIVEVGRASMKLYRSSTPHAPCTNENLRDGLIRKRFRPSKSFSNPSTILIHGYCPALTEKAQLCARLPVKYLGDTILFDNPCRRLRSTRHDATLIERREVESPAVRSLVVFIPPFQIVD
jgi:hypothetical protein